MTFNLKSLFTAALVVACGAMAWKLNVAQNALSAEQIAPPVLPKWSKGDIVQMPEAKANHSEWRKIVRVDATWNDGEWVYVYDLTVDGGSYGFWWFDVPESELLSDEQSGDIVIHEMDYGRNESSVADAYDGQYRWHVEEHEVSDWQHSAECIPLDLQSVARNTSWFDGRFGTRYDRVDETMWLRTDNPIQTAKESQ